LFIELVVLFLVIFKEFILFCFCCLY